MSNEKRIVEIDILSPDFKESPIIPTESIASLLNGSRMWGCEVVATDITNDVVTKQRVREVFKEYRETWRMGNKEDAENMVWAAGFVENTLLDDTQEGETQGDVSAEVKQGWPTRWLSVAEEIKTKLSEITGLLNEVTDDW
jgi:hypothetical protein